MKNVQAVITYRNNGTRRPCGQTIGADGSGTFAILISADTPEEGDELAREQIKKLESYAQYRAHITDVVLVVGYEMYGGNAIMRVTK